MVFNNYLKRALLKDSDNNIIYIIFGLIALCIIGIHVISPDSLTGGRDNDIQVLLINVQILATILAITTSFTILGLQYVSQDLTPRIMSYYIKSNQFLFFFWLYAVGIILNFFVASFPKILEPSQFLFISYILLVFCIISLIVYLKFLIRGIQPTTIISNIIKNIPRNFDDEIIEREHIRSILLDISNDPFIELEQIIIRSIRNNDHTTFSYCLHQIVTLNHNYLQKINGLNVDSGYRDIWIKTYALQKYFLRRYNQILFEILNQNNERFLIEYIISINYILEFLLRSNCDAESINELETQLQDVGKKIIDNHYYRVSQEFIYVIFNIIEIEFSNLPSGDRSVIYSDPIFDISTLSEKENDLHYLSERTHDRFFSLLSYTTEISKEIHCKEFYHIFFSIENHVEKILIEAFKRPFNDSFRKYLIFRLLRAYLENYENDLKTQKFGEGNLSFLLMNIKNYPREYDAAFLKNIMLDFFRVHCDIALRYESLSGITGIGIGARYLIQDFPEITSELVDLLIEHSKKCLQLNTVRENEQLKTTLNQTIKHELNSIKHFNKARMNDIDMKIDAGISQIESIS